MLPRCCTIKEGNKKCDNPPAYIVSLSTKNGEYLLCITCLMHKPIIEDICKDIEGIRFEELKYIGTNCISRVINNII